MIDSDYRRIRAIVSSESEPQEFFKNFVEAFAQMTQVELGLAWNCEREPYAPICQVHRDSSSMVQLPLSSQRHQSLLVESFRQRKASLVSPPSQNDSPVPAILISPLSRGELNGLVEFILPATNSPEENQSIFRVLASCCQIAKTSDSQDASSGTERSALSHLKTDFTVRDVDEFTELVHQSLDFEETSGHVANESRRILNCDRVTVYRRQGKRFVAVAISGQPTVNQRSNEVKVLGELVNTVLQTERSFWFPTEHDVPPQIREPLEDYVQHSMTRSLVVLPVFDQPEAETGSSEYIENKPTLIAGIVVEQANHQWERDLVEPAVHAVAKHASSALRNAHEVNGIFLYPVWRAIGKARAITAARSFPRTAIVAGIVSLMLAAMLFVPADFQLSCDGTIVPSVRQRIFADQAATVKSIEVEHGEQVESGDELLVLENEELVIQREQLQGELNALQQRLAGSRSIRISRPGRDTSVGTETIQTEIQAQIASLRRRLKTVEAKAERLQIKSQLEGQILTWDPVNLLQGRPVQQGDLLLEVADTGGQWQLELDLPDRKIGHLVRVMEANEQPLKVRFTMAAEPGKHFHGTLRRVAHATSVNADRLRVVRVKVDVDEAEIADLKHAGSTVSAKILCGRRRLGFVWLHEAWEFIQYRILFPIW